MGMGEVTIAREANVNPINAIRNENRNWQKSHLETDGSEEQTIAYAKKLGMSETESSAFSDVLISCSQRYAAPASSNS